MKTFQEYILEAKGGSTTILLSRSVMNHESDDDDKFNGHYEAELHHVAKKNGFEHEKDYKVHTAKGDNSPNSITVLNKAMLKNPEVKEMLHAHKASRNEYS